MSTRGGSHAHAHINLKAIKVTLRGVMVSAIRRGIFSISNRLGFHAQSDHPARVSTGIWADAPLMAMVLSHCSSRAVSSYPRCCSFACSAPVLHMHTW